MTSVEQTGEHNGSNAPSAAACLMWTNATRATMRRTDKIVLVPRSHCSSRLPLNIHDAVSYLRLKDNKILSLICLIAIADTGFA